MMRSLIPISLLAIFCSFVMTASAQAKPDKVDGANVPEGRVPQVIVDNKYPRTYFPGTEKLGENEMRITALGTGMPNQSPSNVAACFLVELGNGEAFLFDIGTGSTDRLRGLRPTIRSWIRFSSVTCTPTTRAILLRSGSPDGSMAAIRPCRSTGPRAQPRGGPGDFGPWHCRGLLM